MRRGALLLGSLLVVAACTSDPEPATATTERPATTAPATTASTTTTPTTTSAAPTTTTSSVETSTTTTSTTTTSSPLATVCPIPALLPDGALRLAGGSGDYDGDGQPDSALTYQTGPDSWRIRVTFADGGGSDAVISDAEDFYPPRHLGGFDIDADGSDEALVAVGAGASTVQVGFFDVAACVLHRVTLRGTPASFPVGASLGSTSGIVCPGDGTIERVFAQYVDDDVYEGGLAPYVLEGSVLTELPGDGAGFTADEAFALAVLDCGGLAVP